MRLSTIACSLLLSCDQTTKATLLRPAPYSNTSIETSSLKATGFSLAKNMAVKAAEARRYSVSLQDELLTWVESVAGFTGLEIPMDNLPFHSEALEEIANATASLALLVEFENSIEMTLKAACDLARLRAFVDSKPLLGHRFIEDLACFFGAPCPLDQALDRYVNDLEPMLTVVHEESAVLFQQTKIAINSMTSVEVMFRRSRRNWSVSFSDSVAMSVMDAIISDNISRWMDYVEVDFNAVRIALVAQARAARQTSIAVAAARSLLLSNDLSPEKVAEFEETVCRLPM